MELPMIWETRMQVTKTQRLKHSDRNTVTETQLYGDHTITFYHLECTQIYLNYLYIETCHRITHKACKKIFPKYLFWTLSQNPELPQNHVQFFWKWKEQTTLVQQGNVPVADHPDASALHQLWPPCVQYEIWPTSNCLNMSPENLEKELSGDISFILLRQSEMGQIQGGQSLKQNSELVPVANQQ